MGVVGFRPMEQLEAQFGLPEYSAPAAPVETPASDASSSAA
jgi:hypothetical protein